MTVSQDILQAMENASWIRRMFERGARLRQEKGPDFVQDLSLGNPSLEPPEAFFDVLSDLSQKRESGLHRYMPNAGFPEVRQAIADHLGQNNQMKTDGEHVVMCVGAGGGLNVLFKTILDPGDDVIILAPYFVEYLFYIKNHGGQVKVVPTREDFGLNISAIAEAITDRTRAIVVNSPNNPSGVVYSAQDCQALRELVHSVNEKRDRPMLLVSDEPYREIYYGREPWECPASHTPFGVIVYSWSKSLSIPGNRIGYIAVASDCPSPRLVDGLTFSTRILGFVNAPAICQLAVQALLETQVDISAYRQDRDTIYGALQSAGYDVVKPEGAFYIFPRSPIPDDKVFCDAAAEQGVLVVPGSGFGQPGFFRISFAVPPGVVEKAMEKMGALKANL